MLDMTFDDFQASLYEKAPPLQLPPLLAALWWDARGDWNHAHNVAQDIGSPDGSWVHAYLHRKTGDDGNADYWYGRASKPHSRLPLDAEWEEIVKALLASDTFGSK
jgi:hypothetical protein